ncbi:hypothetical protein LPB67_14990 [Undibacterium sp. Jales W-56]|uniref:anti-sigma factor n=1 Tax=Undibacterium sp. Jales W-56 TaxID=2897325 RepID=UPI0021D108A1|nr:hypothetical protein [Undibacterium sp. Jales W-56]MCU6435082.1 hypothetical protein [Undibacterium sp. Jales W-56]
MSFTDEILMAYADGELDLPTRTAIQAALLQDAELAKRVAQHQALRADVFAAFAPVLNEPIPASLQLPQASIPAAGNKVVQLSDVKIKHSVKTPGKSWSWVELGGLAATLIVGVAVGKFGLQGDATIPSSGGMLAAVNGHVAASGKLAQALTQQLASAPASEHTVKIGVSFLSKEGQFCRSFATENASQNPGLSGLACKQKTGTEWQIAVLAQTQLPATPGAAYRQASAEMSPVVLQAIDQYMAGQTLDAAAERAAQQQGWQIKP